MVEGLRVFPMLTKSEKIKIFWYMLLVCILLTFGIVSSTIRKKELGDSFMLSIVIEENRVK